jgi:diadenylate cyclase
MLTPLQIEFRDCLQIAILAVALYYVLRFIRGTRVAALLMGFGVVVVVVVASISIFNLDVLGWLFGGLALYLAFGIVIIFHPEFRRGLVMFGRQPFLSATPWQTARNIQPERVSEKLCEVVDRLSQRRIGALIAIERAESLGVFVDSGVRIDAPLIPELLQTLFYPPAPLHDGGVIIRGECIVAARCIFPLSERLRSEMNGLGTRHQAAMGLSEASDAVVVAVSEETGIVSIAHDGKFYRDIRPDALRRYLRALDPLRNAEHMMFGRFLERLNRSSQNGNPQRVRQRVRRQREVDHD